MWSATWLNRTEANLVMRSQKMVSKDDLAQSPSQERRETREIVTGLQNARCRQDQCVRILRKVARREVFDSIEIPVLLPRSRRYERKLVEGRKIKSQKSWSWGSLKSFFKRFLHFNIFILANENVIVHRVDGVLKRFSSFFFLSKRELWKKWLQSVEIRYYRKGRGAFFRQGPSCEKPHFYYSTKEGQFDSDGNQSKIKEEISLMNGMKGDVFGVFGLLLG